MKTMLLSFIALTAIASLRIDAAPLDSNAFTFQGSNGKQRANLLSGITHDYGHDSVRRLVQSAVSSNGVPAGQIVYTLDSADNRVQVTGGPDAGLYGMDATLPEPGDQQVNQYTATPSDTRSYDRNGNLISVNLGTATERTFLYDYRGRLVSFHDVATSTFATYRYDALGRRIEKVVTPLDGGAVTARYYFNGRHEIEKRDGGGAVQATFIRGKGGEMLATKSGGETFYFHRDATDNTVAVTDSTSAVRERSDYDYFGKPHFFAANGAPLPASAVGNLWLFRGQAFDAETGFLHSFGNYFDPRAGRNAGAVLGWNRTFPVGP